MAAASDLDDLNLGGDPDVPSVADLLVMIRRGTYDVPALAERLGLSEGHVRLLLATVANDAAD